MASIQGLSRKKRKILANASGCHRNDGAHHYRKKRADEHRSRRDIFCFADERIIAFLRVITQHLNGGVERFRRDNHCDGQKQNAVFAARYAQKGRKKQTYTAAVRCIRMFRSVFTVWKNPRAASRKLSACVRVLPFVFQSGTMLNGVAGSARQAELRHNVFFFFTHAHTLHAAVSWS